MVTSGGNSTVVTFQFRGTAKAKDTFCKIVGISTNK